MHARSAPFDLYGDHLRTGGDCARDLEALATSYVGRRGFAERLPAEPETRPDPRPSTAPRQSGATL